MGVDIAKSMIQVLDEVNSKYVVGVELSGDPRSGSFEQFIPLLTEVRNKGLKISLHCAEIEE